jgi:chemotaxis protein methyltransferase CheR
MSAVNLKSSDIKHILKEVKCNTGIDFSEYAFCFIKRRTELFMFENKIISVTDLIYKLNKSPVIAGNFLDTIFIPPSELFRDAEVWNYIEKDILPKLITKKDIKIHFAYATGGEELYSFLYILNNFYSENIKICVTAVTEKHLSVIKKGEFSLQHLKASQKNIEILESAVDSDDIFIKNKDVYTIKSNYKGELIFNTCNFFKEVFISEFDIVFFRNSMIYFNNELKDKSLKMVLRSLKKTGILLIGEKELLNEESGKKFKRINKTMSIYKKKTFS